MSISLGIRRVICTTIHTSNFPLIRRGKSRSRCLIRDSWLLISKMIFRNNIGILGPMTADIPMEHIGRNGGNR